MSSGRQRSMQREEVRPTAGWGGRARAERLWQETVTQPRTLADNDGESDGPLLTPALSSPRGGEGDKAVARVHVPSPPPGAERDRVRWGRVASRDSLQPADQASTRSHLPCGPAMRKLRALWQSAYHLGLIHDRSDDALGAWLHRLARLDGDAAAPAGLDRPIQALKAWLARSAGVDWRPHLSLGQDGRVWERRRPRARVLEAQWRLLHRRGRVRIGSEAALGAYAARYAGLGRAESHLALDNAQADALIRHLGRRIRAASERHD